MDIAEININQNKNELPNKLPFLSKAIVSIFIASAVYVLSQYIYKLVGMSENFSYIKLLNLGFLFNFYTSIPVILALVLAFASNLLMGTVLSKHPFGYSQSLFLSLVTALSVLVGILFFNDYFNLQNLIGFALLIVGMFLLEKNK